MAAPTAMARSMRRLKPSSTADDREEPRSRLERADSDAVGVASGVSPVGLGAASAPIPRSPPTAEGSNQLASGGLGSAVLSEATSGRVGDGWVLRPEPPDFPAAEPPAAGPVSPTGASVTTSAPAGEEAGAEVA